MNHKTFIKFFINATKMTSISSRVPTHRDEVVTLMGQAELQFTYNNEKTVSSTIFMQGNISNLLKSDILQKIELN